MFASSFLVILMTIKEDWRKTDVVHILKTHQREGTWGTKQKWVKHQEHIRIDETSRPVTRVERLSVLRMTSVWPLPWTWVIRMSRSHPCSPCQPGTTWTSLFHLSLPWPLKSCGWLSTDTRRALCTPTSTMFSPRLEGWACLDWWLLFYSDCQCLLFHLNSGQI